MSSATHWDEDRRLAAFKISRQRLLTHARSESEARVTVLTCAEVCASKSAVYEFEGIMPAWYGRHSMIVKWHNCRKRQRESKEAW
jgi:hypothetical protein